MQNQPRLFTYAMFSVFAQIIWFCMATEFQESDHINQNTCDSKQIGLFVLKCDKGFTVFKTSTFQWFHY